MKLSDINLHDVGIKIQMAGVIYQDAEKTYVLPFPGVSLDYPNTSLDMNHDDWEKFLRQTDLLESTTLALAEEKGIHKFVKIVLRKSARQISEHVRWRVYKRDGYSCRYCGVDDKPLTVDHLVLWEKGGPSTEANLLTACKACNKTRGNMPYPFWLSSHEYDKRSHKLNELQRARNKNVVDTLASIPRLVHQSKKRR